METLNKWLEENPLVEHELIQGTDEWHDFRLGHDGSSEAAPMLGLSKKTSRTELLDMKSSGMSKVFSAWVQKNILDHGHEVEAMARPIVEKQLGRKLYPVVCSRGRPSASCDGKTMAGDVVWEHKQWNEKLAESVRNGVLPEEHEPQCYQNLLVTSAETLIFTVSDGTEENMVSMEVFPDLEWFERIRAGWAQFNKERAAYVPREIAERPTAEVVIDLPALFVHAKGEITEHNMEAFGLALSTRLAEVRAIALVTDQDFSNAKGAAKKFRETAKAIGLSKEAMLAQTETIGEAARKMDAWAKDLNATALQLEKDVEREDMAKKTAMVNEAKVALAAHVDALLAEIKPITLNLKAPNFAESLKAKRNYASMQDAVDTALANAIIEADSVAKDIRGKFAWFRENALSHNFLFHDLQTIITKAEDDFRLLVATRINEHKQAEATKLESERLRIQQEEEVKARAKIEEEAKAKAATEEADRQRANVEAKRQIDETESIAQNVDPSLVTVSDVAHAAMPEAIAEIIAPKPADLHAHQDEIREFLDSLDVDDKKKQSVHPYLVAFVKFQASRDLRKAA